MIWTAEAEEGEAAREHIIVVQYDGEAQTDAFLAIAKQASALVQGGHANLGMGVVSILGFDDSYRIFEASCLESLTALKLGTIAHSGVAVVHEKPAMHQHSIGSALHVSSSELGRTCVTPACARQCTSQAGSSYCLPTLHTVHDEFQAGHL